MSDCRENVLLSRRQILAGAGTSLALWAYRPRALAATSKDPRLLTIVLRGAVDGLAVVAPVGDPDLQRLRGALALPASGEGAGLPLDGFFALNPAMPFLHGLYQKRQALIVHAVATPYRQRSHFDGQDVLESGLPGVGRVDTGWLNRALGGLPHGERANPRGLSMGAVVPLVMQGPAPVLSWSRRSNGLPLRQSTIARLADLYAETDPALGRALEEGIALEQTSMGGPGQPGQGPQFPEFVVPAEAAAKVMSAADGPRLGALSYNGWDTHANEGVLRGQLFNRLSGLDAAIKTYAEGMGTSWKDTVAVIVTEFGRTARINGTSGSDHGTATVAILVGGAVKGGRVIADWPGLAENKLYEGRDLAPTRDLRTVLKGVLRDHLGLSADALASTVFPNSSAASPADGMIA
jgi:uncharacterized protein (DUF1501 family)